VGIIALTWTVGNLVLTFSLCIGENQKPINHMLYVLLQKGKFSEQKQLEDLLQERTSTFTNLFTDLVQAEVSILYSSDEGFTRFGFFFFSNLMAFVSTMLYKSHDCSQFLSCSHFGFLLAELTD
jgi:hypothetical protein